MPVCLYLHAGLLAWLLFTVDNIWTGGVGPWSETVSGNEPKRCSFQCVATGEALRSF